MKRFGNLVSMPASSSSDANLNVNDAKRLKVSLSNSMDLGPQSTSWRSYYHDTVLIRGDLKQMLLKEFNGQQTLTNSNSTTTTVRVKLASFDLDGTIIKTLSGKTFPKDRDDWQFWNSNSVVRKLRELISWNGQKVTTDSSGGNQQQSTNLLTSDSGQQDLRITSSSKDSSDLSLSTSAASVQTEQNSTTLQTTKILIFTNQKGLSKGNTDEQRKKNKDDFKYKIETILQRCGEEIMRNTVVLISCADNVYRKPCIGGWELLLGNKLGEEFKDLNIDVSGPINGNSTMSNGLKFELDHNNSFYCGDAAGRPDLGTGANKIKKDFSDTDLKFALNLNQQFYTPEWFFEGKEGEERKRIPSLEKILKESLDGFDPRQMREDYRNLDDNVKNSNNGIDSNASFGTTFDLLSKKLMNRDPKQSVQKPFELVNALMDRQAKEAQRLASGAPSLLNLVAPQVKKQSESQQVATPDSNVTLTTNINNTTTSNEYISPTTPELILMIGSPASGKSSLARCIFQQKHNYHYVNQDTLKTKEKCLSEVKKGLLELGKSVVVDNINKDIGVRKEYIDLYQQIFKEEIESYYSKNKSSKASEFSPGDSSDLNDPPFIPSIRCICMDVPKQYCKHMNKIRAHNKEQAVPEPVIIQFYRTKVDPDVSKEEGITQILNYQLEKDFCWMDDGRNASDGAESTAVATVDLNLPVPKPDKRKLMSLFT